MLKSQISKSSRFRETKKVVITLHGYGTGGADFAEAVTSLFSQRLDDTVFLFPDAPYRCDMFEFGHQWFKLSDMSYAELREGLDTVSPILREYIEDVSREYSCMDISLIGFSQGAILALEMMMHTDISNVVAYSGMFVSSSGQVPKIKTEILIVHSEDDVVVPYSNAVEAKENLAALGLRPNLFTCRGIGHSISHDGWEAGIQFLKDKTTD
jgi:phospholipase/carboxylesterase